MEDPNKCPICLNHVAPEPGMNCYECMTCKYRVHGSCWFTQNTAQKQVDRYLRDDLVKCLNCGGNNIAYCNDPTVDLNASIKDALKVNPDRRGGKRRSIKTKRVKRSNRVKRTNCVKKSKRSRK